MPVWKILATNTKFIMAKGAWRRRKPKPIISFVITNGHWPIPWPMVKIKVQFQMVQLLWIPQPTLTNMLWVHEENQNQISVSFFTIRYQLVRTSPRQKTQGWKTSKLKGRRHAACSLLYFSVSSIYWSRLSNILWGCLFHFVQKSTQTTKRNKICVWK